MMKMVFLALSLVSAIPMARSAETVLAAAAPVTVSAPSPITAVPASPPAPKKHWYEKINIRGYAQLRYNRLLESNADLRCDQCDRSWGDNNGFFLRRARLVFFGEVHERLYVYIQPDFASDSTTGSQHFAQLRDLYFDLSLDQAKEFRLRFGQSKMPFGFENLQSSQNRAPLDRADALNSAFPNERDLGIVFYWAPSVIRDRFKLLVDSGLKGTGDYGVFGLGIYNGQSMNRPEANNNLHTVMRLTYPVELPSGQFMEASLQGYRGLYSFSTPPQTVNVRATGNPLIDERVAASFIYYPQPLGFQAEANLGEGPTYLPDENIIDSRKLYGGYAMVMYRFKDFAGSQTLMPFVRWQYFNGGKKHETDSRAYNVRDYDLGVEWQPIPAFELTAQYTVSSRKYQDSKTRGNLQEGNLLRLQAQFNY